MSKGGPRKKNDAVILDAVRESQRSALPDASASLRRVLHADPRRWHEQAFVAVIPVDPQPLVDRIPFDSQHRTAASCLADLLALDDQAITSMCLHSDLLPCSTVRLCPLVVASVLFE